MRSTRTLSPPKTWLAPMSGASDAPFRRIAVGFGAPAVVSEMVASADLRLERREPARRMQAHGAGAPWIVQLISARPQDMEAGARIVAAAGADIIDINMGCPARKVTGGQSGSALMRDPDLALAIVEAALEGAGDRPVTLKMRLGWDDSLMTAPEIARRAELAGIAMLTIHGRTRCQFYTGKADWAAIADTVSVVTIPVIANGDIATPEDARTALDQSRAHGVMIGRAAIGRPWLVTGIDAALAGRNWQAPGLAEQVEALRDLLSGSAEHYGAALGVRVFRKHLAAWTDAAPLALDEPARTALRRRLCQVADARALDAALAALAAPEAGARAAA